MRGHLIYFILLFGCQTNEADFPELKTNDAQQIGASSAILEAEVTEVGPIRPITIGFLWDSQGNDLTIATAANKNILGTTSDPRTFSIKVENLLPATTYYYRGFAADSNFTRIYYGDVVSFTTLP